MQRYFQRGEFDFKRQEHLDKIGECETLDELIEAVLFQCEMPRKVWPMIALGSDEYMTWLKEFHQIMFETTRADLLSLVDGIYKFVRKRREISGKQIFALKWICEQNRKK